MGVLEEVRETFRTVPVGTILTTAEIKHMVFAKFETNMGSVIPSDYCYNKTNKGKKGVLLDFNIFLYKRHGVYEYVGENYQP